jgi:hypothetical protein
MNQSRRTFFKRLGMLAAMPFLAKFIPDEKPVVTVGNAQDYLLDRSAWTVTEGRPYSSGNDLTEKTLEECIDDFRRFRITNPREPMRLSYKCHPGNAFPHGTNDLTGENLEKSLLNAIRGKK